MIAGQVISVGRQHAGLTVTAHVTSTSIAIDLPDGGNAQTFAAGILDNTAGATLSVIEILADA